MSVDNHTCTATPDYAAIRAARESIKHKGSKDVEHTEIVEQLNSAACVRILEVAEIRAAIINPDKETTAAFAREPVQSDRQCRGNA
ncbi:hypothetical protein CY652_10025 [Burkholderia sp. WAC0059]|nr:hypothetical protein CY652_10025 [Burkholderia sp. WAC0059]